MAEKKKDLVEENKELEAKNKNLKIGLVVAVVGFAGVLIWAFAG